MPDARRQVTDVSGDDWSLGHPRAPLVVLEYGDFECSRCAATRPLLEDLVAESDGALRLVYRHFPITSEHPHALQAAEAAEAAGARGRFWELHSLMFSQRVSLELPHLAACADAVGVPRSSFERDLRTHAYLDDVRLDFRRGITDGVNETPFLFINRQHYGGPLDRASLQAAIAEHMPALRVNSG